MGHWKLWLESRLEQEEHKKLKDIWNRAIDSLEIGGGDDTAALATGMSNIVYNKKSNNPEIKGAQAVLERFRNNQIFRLVASVSPDMKGTAKEAEDWLNKIANDGKAGGASVGDLFMKVFGDKFDDLSGDDTPNVRDDAKAEVPAQPPKPETGGGADMQDPASMDAMGPENQQPPPAIPQQAMGQPPAAVMGQPQQMPPAPMGAKQGLF